MSKVNNSSTIKSPIKKSRQKAQEEFTTDIVQKAINYMDCINSITLCDNCNNKIKKLIEDTNNPRSTTQVIDDQYHNTTKINGEYYDRTKKQHQ